MTLCIRCFENECKFCFQADCSCKCQSQQRQHTKECIEYNDNHFPAVPYELCNCGLLTLENIHNEVCELRADMDLSDDELIHVRQAMKDRLNLILEDLTELMK